MASSFRAAYSVAGVGLMLVGFGFLLAGIAALFPSASMALLGLVLDVVGLVIFFLEWPRFTPGERRLSAYGAGLYVLGIIISFFTGAFALTLNFTAHSIFHTTSSPLNAALQAIGEAFAGILIYLAFLLFPYGFSKKDEKALLLLGFVGGLVVSVVLNPIAIGGSFYNITNISTLEGLVTDVISIIFGIAYLVIGNNVRVRK